MTLLLKFKAAAQIIRPELPLSAGACVIVGQVIALGQLPPLATALLGFLLGFFLSASAMVFNDYFDLEVDRVNAPSRPLPAGLLSAREAVALGVILALVAFAIALRISLLVFALSLAGWTLGFLYNWKLKSNGLWGNLIVSANVGMTIIIGGLSVGQAVSPLVWVFGLIAFFFDLAEEIAGDAMDMAGDQKRGSRSIAIVYGRDAALRISMALFALVVLLTALPLALGENRLAYWLPIAAMDLLMVVFALRLFRSQTRQEGHRWMRRLYLSATLGLVAFVLVGFIR